MSDGSLEDHSSYADNEHGSTMNASNNEMAEYNLNGLLKSDYSGDHDYINTESYL